MPQPPACLLCRHMVPIVPEDWQPDYPGDVYDRYDVRNAIAETKTHKRIWCALNPTWLEFFTNHYCGQFVHFNGPCGADLNEFLGWSFLQRERDRLAEDNAELKRRLERAREVSSQRLARLKAIDAKLLLSRDK